jgi:phosphate transport system permease protein
LAARVTESGATVEAGATSVERILLKTGNRDLIGSDFRWIVEPGISKQSFPVSMAVLEREEWGAFFGRVIGVKVDGELQNSRDVWADFMRLLDQTDELRAQIRELEQGEIGRVNYQMERLRLAERKLQLKNVTEESAFQAIEKQRQALEANYQELEQGLLALYEAIQRDSIIVQTGDGNEVELKLKTVIDAWKPNAMTLPARIGHFFRKIGSFIVDASAIPRTHTSTTPVANGRSTARCRSISS